MYTRERNYLYRSARAAINGWKKTERTEGYEAYRGGIAGWPGERSVVVFYYLSSGKTRAV